MYEAEVMKSTSFSLPIISVGNLSMGGAGKTPHIEYLIQVLRPYLNLAILSRGYNRKTKGFRFVKYEDNAELSGDEPLMYARKYRDVVTSVCENRSLAVPQILGKYPGIQTILLDDAFQHRSIKPSKNILLTQYAFPFYKDYILPAGRMREPRSAYKRADIIIVTKCPDDVQNEERLEMIKNIAPLKHQKVFFSRYHYLHPYSFYDGNDRINLSQDMNIMLISAIANTSYLKSYIEPKVNHITHMEYEDHHNFTGYDIRYILKVFKALDLENKMIITTEKDAMRLSMHYKTFADEKIPLYILPVGVEIMFDQTEEFNNDIKEFLLAFRS